MQDYTYRDFDIVDAHTHIYPSKIAEKASESIGLFYGLPAHNVGSPEELIMQGSKYGIRNYLVCSVATAPEQVSSINSFIARECKEHPEFIGFGTLHPKMEGADDEIERIIAMGLRGIKLHPDFQQFDIDSPEAYKFFEIVGGRLPFLLHMGDEKLDYSSPKRLAKALDDFPKLEAIAAHLGGYRRWEMASDLLTRPRVKFDTSSSLFILEKDYIKQLINRYGVENCFFGTDFPLWDYSKEVNDFMELQLPFEQMSRILGGNFREYFGL
jgi:predicted TIM-barrel fold metal-dependent hydrolase